MTACIRRLAPLVVLAAHLGTDDRVRGPVLVPEPVSVPVPVPVPASASALALATVTGQLTLLERSGAVRGDLATAIVYLQPLDGPRPEAWGDVPLEVNVAMRGREFLPHVTIVRAGGNVAFPNQDPFGHNVFSNTDPVSFDLGLYRRGATRAATFDTPGVYPVYCNIHARMVSYIVAVPSRHVAHADAEGRFTIPDVPIGSYRLTVWHERALRVVQALTVSAAGATPRIELDARAYIAGTHLNKFGVPYSATRVDRY